MQNSFVFFIGLIFCFSVFSQNDTLPFKIDSSKMLSKERLAQKKEGWMLTGLPRLSYDPIQGFGFGGRGQLYFNNTRQDPFFAFTPYRARIDISLNASQNGKVGAGLKLDMPYFLGSKWRARARFAFADNPNKPYFGLGEHSLESLEYTDPITGEVYENLRFDEYSRLNRTIRPGNPLNGEDPDQWYTDRRYNWIHYRKFAFDAFMERTLMDGKLRLVNGFGVINLNYTPYDFETVPDALDLDGNTISAINGVTKLTEDYNLSNNNPSESFWTQNNITGYQGGFLVKLKAGLIYDTRDFEPDPSKGSLVEYSVGYSPSWLGSDFNYVRNQFQAQKFLKVFKFMPNENILAGRFMFSTIQGTSVFFREIFDIWSASQGRIGVMGGEDALRGYKKFRFGGMIYSFANIELRSSITKFTLLKQDIKLSAVPFFDAGRVWDNFQNMQLKGMKYSPGIGARIAWNQSTVLRIDYSYSKEDSQLFFVVGHIF